jgi:hypothetical protein
MTNPAYDALASESEFELFKDPDDDDEGTRDDDLDAPDPA